MKPFIEDVVRVMLVILRSVASDTYILQKVETRGSFTNCPILYPLIVDTVSSPVLTLLAKNDDANRVPKVLPCVLSGWAPFRKIPLGAIRFRVVSELMLLVVS